MKICTIINHIKRSFELFLDILEEILLVTNYKLL